KVRTGSFRSFRIELRPRFSDRPEKYLLRVFPVRGAHPATKPIRPAVRARQAATDGHFPERSTAARKWPCRSLKPCLRSSTPSGRKHSVGTRRTFEQRPLVGVKGACNTRTHPARLGQNGPGPPATARGMFPPEGRDPNEGQNRS